MSITVQTFTSSTQVDAKVYLRSLLVPTYFSSYEVSSEDDKWDIYYDLDTSINNHVFQVYAASNDVGFECAAYYDQSNYYHCRHNPSYSSGGQSGTITKIISCDCGVLIIAEGIGVIITKTNNNKTAVVCSCNYQTGNSGQEYKYTYIAPVIYGGTGYNFTYSPISSKQTQLVPFNIKMDEYDQIYYTPNACYMPVSELYSYISGYKFTAPDGYEWITNGYWAIRDKNPLASE